MYMYIKYLIFMLFLSGCSSDCCKYGGECGSAAFDECDGTWNYDIGCDPFYDTCCLPSTDVSTHLDLSTFSTTAMTSKTPESTALFTGKSTGKSTTTQAAIASYRTEEITVSTTLETSIAETTSTTAKETTTMSSALAKLSESSESLFTGTVDPSTTTMLVASAATPERDVMVSFTPTSKAATTMTPIITTSELFKVLTSGTSSINTATNTMTSNTTSTSETPSTTSKTPLTSTQMVTTLRSVMTATGTPLHYIKTTKVTLSISAATNSTQTATGIEKPTTKSGNRKTPLLGLFIIS